MVFVARGGVVRPGLSWISWGGRSWWCRARSEGNGGGNGTERGGERRGRSCDTIHLYFPLGQTVYMSRNMAATITYDHRLKRTTPFFHSEKALPFTPFLSSKPLKAIFPIMPSFRTQLPKNKGCCTNDPALNMSLPRQLLATEDDLEDAVRFQRIATPAIKAYERSKKR